MDKKYKIITLDLQKNLIEFLDEIQFDAAKEGDTDSMHKVNFCSWAIKELMNSFDGYLKDKPKKGPNKKSRDQYVDETFMDWNLPDMTDEEYENLVDTFDNFLRGWEKEYNKKNPKKKPIKERPYKPHINDVAEFMSLDEIKEFLLDDPELTDAERFELYYEERERMIKRKENKKSKSLDKICKELNIKRNPDKESN